jgi:hypothetical protein
VLPPDLDKASIVQPEFADQDALKAKGKLGETVQEDDVLSRLKALFDANAQQDQTVKRTYLVNSLEKDSLLLSVIEEAGLTVDLSVLQEPDTNGNENISWGAFEAHLKGVNRPTTADVFLTPEEIKAAEAAAANRLDGVFGKMCVRKQTEDDSKLPMLGDTQSIAAMLRDDPELAALIVEAGLSSFCFVLERLGDKGVDMELLTEELEAIVAARSVTARAPEVAVDGPVFPEAEPQPMPRGLCCWTHQPSAEFTVQHI